MTRRVIAAVAAVVVLILIVLGVRSCQISARNSSLKDFANNVSVLNQQSVQTGQQFFNQLGSASKSNATSIYNQLNETRLTADNQLNKAQGLDVPDEMKAAESNFVTAMEMRRNGIAGVASQIQQALGTTTSRDAINAIAADMAQFYASDVLYKNYTAPLMSGALKSAGIAVGGANGIALDSHQFLPSIDWLDPTQIGSKLGSSAGTSTASGPAAPGLHGHSLDSVSVGGTTLQTGSTNTLPANQAPTVTLNFTNGGTNNEKNVVCKVSISGTSASGQTTVPQTTAGQSSSCQVTLSSAPPAGNYTMTAEIVPVPGEKKVDNNTLTFPITIQ